ncbi:MAG: hypothetical protein RL179_1061 [Planctomycetota bacterium]
MRTRLFSLLILLLLLIPACGEDGPRRYKLSGDAQFDGQPIAYGDVIFTPDGSKSNSGPQGVAYINNGKFDTNGPEGKGIAGGPTVIHVRGLSAQGGRLICEYEWSVDLPRADGKYDIKVPKEAAAKKVTKPQPEI